MKLLKREKPPREEMPKEVYFEERRKELKRVAFTRQQTIMGDD